MNSSNPPQVALRAADRPRLPRLALLVAAALPGSALAGDPTTIFDFVVYPGAPAGDFDLYIKPALFPHAFANDLPARTAAVLAASQRPPPSAPAPNPPALRPGRPSPAGIWSAAPTT